MLRGLLILEPHFGNRGVMGDPAGMEMKRTGSEGTLGVAPAWKPSCGSQATDSKLGVINHGR